MNALKHKNREAKKLKKQFEKDFQNFLSNMVVTDKEAFLVEINDAVINYLKEHPGSKLDLNDQGAVVGYGCCLLYEKKITLTTVTSKEDFENGTRE